MKYLHIYLLSTIVFVACSEPQIKYFYSDGTPIDTSLNIDPLKAELNEIISEKKLAGDLTVYTSLNWKIHSAIDVPLLKHIDSIASILKEEHPNQANFLDSLHKIDKICQVGLFVMENKSGRVLMNYNYPGSKDMIGSRFPVAGWSKSFLYALAMDKEYKPRDYYPKSRMLYTDSGIVEVRDTTHRLSFLRVFSTGLVLTQGELGKRYSAKEYALMVNRLGCDTSNNDFDYPFFEWQISLSDILTAHLIFKNKGNFIKPNYIDSICSSDISQTYKAKFKYEKVISDTTALEMLKLLEYFVDGGQGTKIRWEYKVFDNLAGKFAGSPRNLLNGFVCISDDYAIGVRVVYPIKQKQIISITYRVGYTSILPIWYELYNLLKGKRD